MSDTSTSSTISTVEELITLGLSIFTAVFNLFNKSGVPTSAAPAITSQLKSTPGATTNHSAVIESAVTTAASVANAVTGN